ncbi:restriction endonuclease subunit S [Pseudidiomarina sp. 1APP75-32.1]|uniref:Restriction endonuclease subunit S n=1 Tax=Pseudidiomarina terrestris TaxID=2820060 RepID=A0AAW7QZU1_9GAMM|nr:MULTISPECIES: restriction endonuclease subunit S [unclassified Pseudidiomarina]MDN7125662.1 restriction endonuclease subunit S [Pseudidiomarina sp. 1APP75-32.1]MDN7130474.1 restriction endonuclease subunit S [Pseudidiomarina sp. 1APR75-15]
MSLSAEFLRFPPHWTVLPFTDAVKDATSGNAKLKKDEYLTTGSVPIVDQGQSLYGGYTDKKDSVCKSELPTIVFGDHTRAFKFIDEPFALGADGAKVLEPRVKLDKRFLFHYLKQLRIESAGYSRHYKFLKESYVPVPPLSEQKRIAAILDKADAIRRKRQQAIQLADDFLRSVFLDMFGDPVTNPKGFKKVPITELADVITGFAFKSNEYVSDSSESVRLCRGANTLTGNFNWNDTAFWPKNKLKKLTGYLIKAGDIILAMDRPWISSGLKVCVFPENQRETYLVQRVARLRPHRDSYTNYIYSCIQSKAFEKHCCPTETTVPHISPIELKSFEVLLPSAELIDKYHLIISKVNCSLGEMVDGKCRSEENFTALSHRAFTGQL